MVKEISEYIKDWSTKLSIPINEIENEFSSLLEEEGTIHSDLSEDERKQRALSRLALSYKKMMRTPAVGFEGIIIGVSDSIDMVAKRRRTAEELFKNNPQEAVMKGITDEQGNPLDTTELWGEKRNPNFGKPLPKTNLMRNIYGVATKSSNENDTPKFFSLTIQGDKAGNEKYPMFTPVRFMAIDKTKDDNKGKVYSLNASSFTNFKVDSSIQLPPIETILQNSCSDIFSKIEDLEEYHSLTKDDYNRIVITEGSVSTLNLEPTAFGSRVMNIEDEELALENIDAKSGVTCWLPLRENIDFAEGSKVLVVGRTNQGKRKDDEGNLTEELGDITINTFGVYAIPAFKIEVPSDIQEITE